MILLITFAYLSEKEFFALLIVKLVGEVKHLIFVKYNKVQFPNGLPRVLSDRYNISLTKAKVRVFAVIDIILSSCRAVDMF